jgi:hypothetical protein
LLDHTEGLVLKISPPQSTVCLQLAEPNSLCQRYTPIINNYWKQNLTDRKLGLLHRSCYLLQFRGSVTPHEDRLWQLYITEDRIHVNRQFTVLAPPWWRHRISCHWHWLWGGQLSSVRK